MNHLTTKIFGGGPFLSGGSAVIDDLKSSGFTTVIAWSVHLNAGGDLIYNDEPPFVRDGAYSGDPGWPGRLAGLKRGGSVNRLFFSVGSAGSQDFHNIGRLIRSQGTGPGTALFENFKALKDAIPVIDGIDLDDEDLQDRETTVAFSRLLHAIGYEVTFNPFSNEDFWIDCLQELEGVTPGLVSGFNLQCYDGGAGNDPGQWIDAIASRLGGDFDARGLVSPGLWCRHGNGCGEGDDPDAIARRFDAWKGLGIRGGWIWIYDDIRKCAATRGPSGPTGTAAYAGAIVEGLS